MAKVITFSRYFPKTHPRSGEPTYFVEQILNQMKIDYKSEFYLINLFALNHINISAGKLTTNDLVEFQNSLAYDVEGLKHHTIRNGNRFIKGEYFSPRVWSKSAYNSPQIIFLHDTEVKKATPVQICSFFYDGAYTSTQVGILKDTVLTKYYRYGLLTGSNKIEFVYAYHMLSIPCVKITDCNIYKNDGLSLDDFTNWFIPSKKCKELEKSHEFKGQIICWSEDVNY